MSIDKVLTVLNKPENPYKPGVPEHWTIIEEKLGVSLPNDYKSFINVFGSGKICDLLLIHNPFLSDFALDWFFSVLSMYRVIRQGLSHEFAPPLFPEEDGLLPCAETDNGGAHLMWVTKRLPDTWTIALVNYDSLKISLFNCNLTDLIFMILNGGVPRDALNYDDFECHHAFTPLIER